MNNIRKLRLEKELTMADLAIKVKVSMSTIQLWEKGVTTPKPENIEKLREVLGGELNVK